MDIEKRKDIYINLIQAKDDNTQEILMVAINQLLQLEQQLEELKKIPHLLYKKSNPAIQQITPAGKLYKDRLSSYQGLLQTFLKLTSSDDDGDDAVKQLYQALDQFR